MNDFPDIPQSPLPPADSAPSTSDVVVIGAGLAGSLTALYLARGGVDVVVLESRQRVGAGRFGRDLGHVETGVVEHAHRTVSSLGAARAAELFAWTTRSRELLAAEGLFERTGMLWCAQDGREPDDIDKSAAALNDLGIAAQRLDPDEVAHRTGGADFGPALWLPDDGCLTLDAPSRLREAANRAGVRFFRGDARFDEHDSADGIRVLVGEHAIDAEIAVIAAGTGSRSLDARLASALHSVREQGMRLAAVHPEGSQLIGRAGQGWTSWRWLDDGHLAVSGARWATQHLEVGETDDTVIVDAIQDKLEAFAARRFGATDVQHRWAWTFANTTDGLPVVGPLPGDPRKVVAAGFGPNGSSLEPAAARAVADGLLGGETEAPWFLSAKRMVRWR